MFVYKSLLIEEKEWPIQFIHKQELKEVREEFKYLNLKYKSMYDEHSQNEELIR